MSTRSVIAGAGMRVVQVQTKTAAHVVVRDGSGRKLFDMSLPRGVSITLTASIDAEIKVEPNVHQKR